MQLMAMALRAADEMAVKWIASYGVDSSCALLVAIRTGRSELVHLIMRYRPDPNLDRGRPLREALYSTDFRVMKVLVMGGATLSWLSTADLQVLENKRIATISAGGNDSQEAAWVGERVLQSSMAVMQSSGERDHLGVQRDRIRFWPAGLKQSSVCP